MSRVPVFYRLDTTVHPYETPLDAIFRDPDAPEDRASARNFSQDHRVSEDRERRFRAFIDSRLVARRKECGDAEVSPTPTDLIDGAKLYFKSHVCEQPVPDFASPALNGANLLKLDGERLCEDEEAPAEDELLVNVFDLNGLIHIYRKAATHGRGGGSDWQSDFSGLEGKVAEIGEWLKGKLGATKDRESFVALVLEALKIDRAGWPGGLPMPYHPTWVARWSEFKRATGWEPGEAARPETWAEVTGVPKGPGRWLILLVYPVAAVPTLARPTVLDNAWFPRHFPSPPCARPGTGGHPVDLGGQYRAGRPISEFIHAQIDFDIKFWKNSGCAIGCTSTKAGADLGEERRAHRLQLGKHYRGTCPDDWMKDPY